MRTISLIEFLTKVRALPIHLYQDFFFSFALSQMHLIDL